MRRSATPNPSLHPTFNSRLRRLLPAGELKRWATAEYEALMRTAVHIGTTEHLERAHREVRLLIETQCHSPSAPRNSLHPLRRSRSGGWRRCSVESVHAESLQGRPSCGGRLATELCHRCSLAGLCCLHRPLLPRPSLPSSRARAMHRFAASFTNRRQCRPAQPRIAPDVLQRASLAFARG
jgi:hypothetical protein